MEREKRGGTGGGGKSVCSNGSMWENLIERTKDANSLMNKGDYAISR